MRVEKIITSSVCLLIATISSVSAIEGSDHIFFTTWGVGIQSYSLGTSTVSTVVKSDVNFDSIAYDSINNKIYYGSYNPAQIYRGNVDGSRAETLESNVNFEYVRGLAVDGRTGNLYVVSSGSNNNLVVCNTTASNLICSTLLANPDSFYGISLDPVQGEMFISGYVGIYRAGMDGSNLTRIVTGGRYNNGVGIVVDPISDRLYWSSFRNSRIASSFRNGSNAKTVVLLDQTAGPWGLIALNGSIYWSDLADNAIHHSSTAGEDVATAHSGRGSMWHLALVPSSSASLNEFRNHDGHGSNPCEGRGCSHICALAAKFSRCLCPQALHLAEDQSTCVGSNDNRM